MLNDEIIYYNFIALKVDLITIEEYRIWLDNIFMENTDNELLVELEFSSNDFNKTMYIMDIYFYDKNSSLDWNAIGNMIIDKFKDKYRENPYVLKELTHKLYSIWNLLPPKVSEKEPFFTMSYIDDAWSWGDKDSILKRIDWLIDYYEND